MASSPVAQIVRDLERCGAPFVLVVQSPDPQVYASDNFSRNQAKHISDVVRGRRETDNPVVLDMRPFLTQQRRLELARCSDDENRLNDHYFAILRSLTQVVCKQLAKEWIKVVEPHKQSRFPYKFADKPGWWPAEVPHTEPDHLSKENRMVLMVAVLRYERVAVTDLKRATNAVQAHFDGAHDMLYELFYVAVYERFFLGYGLQANWDLWSQLGATERSWFGGPRMFLPVSDVPLDPKKMNPMVFRQHASQHVNHRTVALASCFGVSPGTPESEHELKEEPKGELQIRLTTPGAYKRPTPACERSATPVACKRSATPVVYQSATPSANKRPTPAHKSPTPVGCKRSATPIDYERSPTPICQRSPTPAYKRSATLVVPDDSSMSDMDFRIMPCSSDSSPKQSDMSLQPASDTSEMDYFHAELAPELTVDYFAS